MVLIANGHKKIILFKFALDRGNYTYALNTETVCIVTEIVQEGDK